MTLPSDEHEDRIVATYVENVLKRAQQIAQIHWTPVGDVPNNQGFYSAGVEVIGIPYSSVKEKDKFVGLDVSFTTFMTAVHNPRSVLYTENVRKAPYSGVNCASYYGTVCSSAVDYALGLKANYTTAMIDTLSFFEKISIQVPDSIQLCDVLWSPGHEVMVYDIVRRDQDDSIYYVSILESASTSTRIKRYSFKDFINRWKQMGWIIYRYNSEKQEPYYPCPFVSIGDEPSPSYVYNDIICPSRGDYAVYREGESVVINILQPEYDKLLLFRDNSLVETRYAGADDEVYEKLAFGSYSLVAVNNKEEKSNEVHFEVVDTNVAVGNRYMIRELTDEDIQKGRVTVLAPLKVRNCYCKVFFYTGNGTATNEPLLISL